MNVQIPPAIFYFIGALLVVFGALRAYHLGWKKKPANKEELEEEAGGWARDTGYKRHLTFGVVWMVMGLFLLVSTIISTRR
jgi:hypothetical protein